MPLLRNIDTYLTVVFVAYFSVCNISQTLSVNLKSAATSTIKYSLEKGDNFSTKQRLIRRFLIIKAINVVKS